MRVINTRVGRTPIRVKLYESLSQMNTAKLNRYDTTSNVETSHVCALLRRTSTTIQSPEDTLDDTISAPEVWMIYANLRSGNYGIGVVGDNLVSALSALAPVHRLGMGADPPEPLPGPLLERIFRFERTYTATRYVAYIAFEDDLRIRRVAMKARDLYDVVVTLCSWCEQALRESGLTAVTTIHQGVDGTYFNPGRAVRRRLRDRFVVFSGGKLELRKSQDVVLRAFRIFAERHSDAFLVASWQQPWTPHAATMLASPHVPFAPMSGEQPGDALRRWIEDAGIDVRRVDLVPPLSHHETAMVYGDTDIGLFPSRCESGCNLVMMEYMACGRPVVATDFSGHRDILSPTNSLRLQRLRPITITRRGEASACWCEPDVDEVVACLEQAYDDPSRMETISRQAAADLVLWTWERAARNYLPLLLQGDRVPT